MEIHVTPDKIKFLSPDELKPNPKNRNKHSTDQINRLIKLIEHHGFRTPIIVSTRSGLVVAGNGRLLAAKKMKLKEVPVLFQDFESEEAEWSFGISDNSIAQWSELDMSGINMDLPDFGPDLNIDLLGIKNFVIDIADKEFAPSDSVEADTRHKLCPHCGEVL